MSFITVGTDSAGDDIKIHYQDVGTGAPVVLIHGWPLSGSMWDYQLAELPKHNLRVIAYDRRGFGHSSKPWDGYEYDTLADDLKILLETLDLQEVTLVGFSMGGGEVARYMRRHGGTRVAKVAFISAVTPYLLQTDDNPEGVDQAVFDEILTNLQQDRAAFLQTFGKQFYGVNLLSHPVSQAHLDGDFARAYVASHKATLDCAQAFATTDFRQDLSYINVPTLIIHGDADKTVPIESSGELTAQALPHAEYLVYEGAPHGLYFTEKDRFNQDLIAFVQNSVGSPTPEPAGSTTLY
ncbi:alpha/beta fold hydrolase [Fibrella forsythiae]|uniref:Alpha/beta hydrolase n=1 Tax=Fibrella forsythiae TaxID=2817061 RepID=A0ABS3JSQ4_9BACT|nr:alpha/beta hydrolase [Fibrella forsythiae]MBO0953047.1 alpha/beta hydrolase [Fibrella forsythiae]